MGKLEEAKNSRWFIAVLVRNNGDAGYFAARIKLDADGLRLATNAVPKSNRERVTFNHNRSATLKQQPCPFF
jgi:hypothetical protein